MFSDNFKKVNFTLLLAISLASPLLAMDEMDATERGLTKPIPSKIKDIGTWIWNNGGSLIDYSILTGSTVAGHYAGSVYGQDINTWIAKKFDARPIRVSFNDKQLYDLQHGYLDHRKETISNGIPSYGFPYDNLSEDIGAVCGFYIGRGLVQLRQWSTNKVIEFYPKVKSSVGHLLYSTGQKLTKTGENLKED